MKHPRPALFVLPLPLLLALALPTRAEFVPDPSVTPLTITGQTEPAEKVEIPTVLRGQLIRVSVKEGQQIKKGDEIAQLDNEIQKQTVALAQLEADSTVEIRAAETQVNFNQNQYDRFKKVASVSSAELREKELAVTQAQLVLEQKKEEAAKKKIDLAREQATLDHMTIRSPLDGSVLRLNKHPGELVDIDKPFAIVVQTSKLDARFYPPKQLFGKIKPNDTITIDLKTEPPTHHTATVIAVDPTVDAASQLFQIKVELDNADQKIPAGTPATWTWHP